MIYCGQASICRKQEYSSLSPASYNQNNVLTSTSIITPCKDACPFYWQDPSIETRTQGLSAMTVIGETCFVAVYILSTEASLYAFMAFLFTHLKAIWEKQFTFMTNENVVNDEYHAPISRNAITERALISKVLTPCWFPFSLTSCGIKGIFPITTGKRYGQTMAKSSCSWFNQGTLKIFF